MRDARQRLGRQRPGAIEREHAPAHAPPAPAAFSGRRVVPRISQPRAASRRGQRLGRVAEPEAEESARHAAAHSSRTPSSGSPSPCVGAELAHPRGRSKPRQRPDRSTPHQRRRIAEQPLGHRQRALGSPLLPIAISTLRTNRSRPMRLTGLPAKRCRKPASSRRSELGQRRGDQVLARLQLHLVRRLRELVPRADGEAVVAAIDPVAHQRPQLARDRPLCSMVR